MPGNRRAVILRVGDTIVVRIVFGATVFVLDAVLVFGDVRASV